MKITSKSLRQSLIAATLLCLLPFGAKADDCSFGDCFLVREAVREQQERLDEYRRDREARFRRIEKEEEDERQLAEKRDQDVRASVVLAAAKAKASNEAFSETLKNASKNGKKQPSVPASGTKRPIAISTEYK